MMQGFGGRNGQTQRLSELTGVGRGNEQERWNELHGFVNQFCKFKLFCVCFPSRWIWFCEIGETFKSFGRRSKNPNGSSKNSTWRWLVECKQTDLQRGDQIVTYAWPSTAVSTVYRYAVAAQHQLHGNRLLSIVQIRRQNVSASASINVTGGIVVGWLTGDRLDFSLV